MSTSLEQSPATAQACPVCSSTTIEFHFAKRGLAIVRCTDCDTAFHPARPSVEALKDLYSERYFTAGGFEGYPDYVGDEPAHRTQARYYLKHIRKLGIPTGRVLDVGCAAGFFLDEARMEGWECSGCDISEFAARHAREALGLDAVHAPFLEADFPEQSFDLITLFSVIAHLPDPPVVAERLHALLKPGGFLLLETSNRDALAPRLLGPRWHLCSPPSVLYFFNQASLRRLFDDKRWRAVSFAPSIKWISLDHGLSRIEGRAGDGLIGKGVRAFRRATGSRLMVPYLGRDIALAVFQKL